MSKTINYVAVVSLTMLAGCGAFVPIQAIDRVGIDIVLAASKVKVVTPEVATTMHNLGKIEGHSCMNDAWDPAGTRVGAVDQVRILAAQMGATAISDPICEEGGVSLIKNCWQSWECKASAFK